MIKRNSIILLFGIITLVSSFVLLNSSNFLPPFFSRNFHPVTSHFSCRELGRGVGLKYHPASGRVSNQFERRTMIEMRIYDCFWRAYRYLDWLKADTADETHLHIVTHLRVASWWAREAMKRYQERTTKILSAQEFDDYHISEQAATWIFSEYALNALRNAALLNITRIEKQPESEMKEFLGLDSYASGSFSQKAAHPADGYKDNQNAETREKFGLIYNHMTFPPLTDDTIVLLDGAQRSHTMWVEAALSRKEAGVLQRLVEEHHRLHERVELSAHTADQQVLLTLPEHTHEICWNRSAKELNELIGTTEAHHIQWMQAVKNRDFRNAWVSGLRHARTHAMLATCNLYLPDILAD